VAEPGGDLGPTAIAAGLATGALKFLFSFRRGDIPVCKTRILHDGRGFPWNHQVAIHPLRTGKLEITAVPKGRRRRRYLRRGGLLLIGIWIGIFLMVAALMLGIVQLRAV
jgi:hypothetical protein